MALPATQPVPPPEADSCIRDTSAGRQSLECEGLSFELSVPEACQDTACGLIVDVHGFGMNGPTEDLHTQLSEIATREGFIVMQPSAPVDGDSGFASWSSSGSNDGQVLAILNRIKNVFHVMDERVHMTGYSQGGFMTWRFLCAQTELFGSVAPLSAGSGNCFGDDLPSEEVDILYGHGTSDGLVPFAGATTTIERINDRWNMTSGETLSQDADHEWTRYTNDRGTRFEFIQWEWETSLVLGTSPLLGHCFPGSDGFVGCGLDNAFHWGEELTKFFLEHPRG
ncbi:MAG: hypothetical protein P8R42_24795 [Candidatus Binatia bacterium]|nr:hypothetical protein [Candidatus Binatia bacterium]